MIYQGFPSDGGKSKELLRRGFSLWSSKGSPEALADAVGRWKVTLPGCWAQLAGWAVAEGVSHGSPESKDLSQPHTEPSAPRQGGQVG